MVWGYKKRPLIWNLLTILTGGNFLSLNSVQQLLLTFFICLQNQLCLHILLSLIKGYRCLKNMIHQIDRKWMVAPFSKFYCKIWIAFFSNTRKHFFLRGFILKLTYRAFVLLKNGTRHFQKSPQFERSACFQMTITWNYERFQYF